MYDSLKIIFHCFHKIIP